MSFFSLHSAMKEHAMHLLDAKVVQDKDGRCGTILSAAPHSSSNATQVVVQLESGHKVLVSGDALVPQPDGHYSLPLRLAELEHTDGQPQSNPEEPLVIPVIVEELDVQKRVVETGTVRITKVVHEQEALVDEPSWHDEVTVTRVPVQRVVDGPIPVRHEDDTMIVSIMEEVLVVEKRLLLKEELHIRKQRVETHQPQHITLRSEEALVERLNHIEP
jgi:uncharacterized protein (TIGR02271 family)